MRSSTSFALIALALGATAIALPMDSYTDLAERDESFDLETRMFEVEDLDARDFDWEDELVARQESTTPTETTPTPASPGAGAPGTSLASGGRKHRHHKGKGFRHGHKGYRKGRGRKHRKYGKNRHGRKGAKQAALTQENPAPPTTVSTEASPALAAREPEPFSLFGLGKKKHATKVEETTPSNLKANSTSDPEPATPSASASGTPKKKHRKHRKHRKNGKHGKYGKNARKHRKLHKHKLEEPAANATTSAV